MNAPDWRGFVFDNGVISEPVSDGSRVVLWVPSERDGNFQYWERIGNVARAEITLADGLRSTAAASIRARQSLKRSLGQLFERLREPKDNRDFALPNGGTSRQCGERRTDLLLVWTDDKDESLDLDRVKTNWPQGKTFQKLGRNLALVSGVEVKIDKPDMAREPPPPGCPRAHADQLLAEARRTGDRGKEASALTDLGAVCLSEGDPQASINHLQAALEICRSLGDRAKASDIIGNLGMAALAVGQSAQAREMVEQE